MIYVGESSYGRSFRMAGKGCDGPLCTFLGDRLTSFAAKGECADTAGYLSNAEIDRIKYGGEIGVKTWYDGRSNSDIMVYGGKQTTKCKKLYQCFNQMLDYEWVRT